MALTPVPPAEDTLAHRIAASFPASLNSFGTAVFGHVGFPPVLCSAILPTPTDRAPRLVVRANVTLRMPAGRGGRQPIACYGRTVDSLADTMAAINSVARPVLLAVVEPVPHGQAIVCDPVPGWPRAIGKRTRGVAATHEHKGAWRMLCAQLCGP